MSIMKKTLVCMFVTTAVTAGTGLRAQPASGPQLYGLIGAYVAKAERSGGPPSMYQLAQGGMATSFLGVRGSEDIGGGIRVMFALESFFRPNTGASGRTNADPFFSRNSWVGASGGFGRTMIGRMTNPTYSNMALLSPFGGSTSFSPLVLQSFVVPYGNAIIGDSVWNNAIEYATPTLNGFTGKAIYGLSDAVGGSGANNIGLHASYTGGPLTAALSVQRVRVPVVAPMTQQKTYLAGLAYDFNVAKVYGSLERTKSDGTTNNTNTRDLGLRVPVGKNGAVLAEWATTKREAVKDTTRSTASLGFDYFLSKRTDLVVVYSRDKLTGFGSANTYAAGIRHTF